MRKWNMSALLALAALTILAAGCQVTIEPPPRASTVVVSEEARIVRGATAVRTCPSSHCDPLMTVYRDWPVRVIRYDRDWVEVHVVNTSVRGWMLARMLY